MSAYTFVRDSFCGRVIYHFSSHKLFAYKEENPNYVIPDKYLATEQDTKVKREDSESTDTSSSVISDKIIVTWDGEDDKDNPKNWSLWLKGIFIIEVGFLTTAAYMASAMYSPGIEDIIEQFQTTTVIATLPLTMFVVGYGLAPMVLSPVSESASFGRNYIYIATLLVFCIFQIPISLTNDLPTLIVLRFFSGLFSSPALATGAASMGDITDLPYLPITIAIWGVCTIYGPSFGPFFGSILVVKRDWHWTFWLTLMHGGIALVVLGWFLPEAYEPTLLLRKAKRLRKLTGNDNIVSPSELETAGLSAKQIAIETFWRPVEISFCEPIVLAINIYIALVYSIVYLWFESFPIVFREAHHFAMIPFGATFISICVGVTIGAVVYISYIYKNYTLKQLNNEKLEPEVFLPVMIFGAVLMPIGIFIFAWTSSPDLHWFGPLVGAAIYSSGSFIVFQTGFNYLGASFYRYLASVFAGNNLFRSTSAGCFPLFAKPLFNNLGSEKYPVGWGSSLLGFITVAMIAIPVTFYLKGPKLRARSKYSNVE